MSKNTSQNFNILRGLYETKALTLVKVGNENRCMPATGSGIPVISINQEAQINSEIEILKGRSLIQDVVTSLGPATIHPNLDAKKTLIVNSDLI